MPARTLFTAPWFGPAALALTAWCILVASLDPAGSYPGLPEGPGLTVDEMFNVEQGVYLVEVLKHYGLGLLDVRSIQEAFGQNPYLPDHPPLGRLWLGVHHHLTWTIAPPDLPDEQRHPMTVCARTGSATAFALTILLIGWFSGANFGPFTGFLSALLLMLMPRLWGHAHLASLETITNLTCTAAVLAVAHSWNKTMPPSVRASLLAGLILGLAFLTKIQAVLLPLPIIVWTFWRWRLLAVKPLAIWGLTAAVIFFIGWPWLWLDPVGHAREYFGRTTARAALSVWYFGTKYADKAVPWHYPWVLFFTTMPICTVALGCRSFWPKALMSNPLSDVPDELRQNPDWSVNWLLTGCVLWSLVVFSLPGVAVYDCERLFLIAFPLWAILAGRSAALLMRKVGPFQIPYVRYVLLTIVLLVQLVNLGRFSPCHLSFYNQFVGGTAGANRLGLETTYWGDSVTRDLLQEVTRHVPQGGTVQVAPVLHQFQLDDLIRQSPILRRHQLQLQPYEGDLDAVRYLLLFRRQADLSDDLRSGPANAELLAEIRRGNTQLAAFYRLSSITAP